MRPASALAAVTLSALALARPALAFDCDVHRYRSYCEQYPGAAEWTADDPYPPQGASDGWPICTSADGSVVAPQFPKGRCLPGSATPIEVGRCEPAAHYYEQGGGEPAAPHAHYAYVANREHCEPCAYEVRTAVATCKSLCEDVFGGLGFDGTDFVPMDASDARSMRTLELSTGRYEDLTPLQACVENCGPANHGAPFVAKGRDANQEAKGDHWYHTTYGRDWDPNTNLDNWLRSYAANQDKRTAPTNVCRKLVDQYCIDVTTDLASERECRRIGRGFGIASDIGFCEDWFRGSYLCEDTCHAFGRDAAYLPEHICGALSSCDEVRAVCRPRGSQLASE
jgi:hypothetical protein